MQILLSRPRHGTLTSLVFSCSLSLFEGHYAFPGSILSHCYEPRVRICPYERICGNQLPLCCPLTSSPHSSLIRPLKEESRLLDIGISKLISCTSEHSLTSPGSY